MDDKSTLPAEIERDIFETTAVVHPQTIPHLLRVARRVLVWIEPFLYRVVSLRQPYTPGIRALLQKPPEFWNLAVRHLVLLDAGDPLRFRLVDACKDITSLGIDSINSPVSLPSLLPERRIRRLAVSLARIAPELRRSLFATITHLAVLDINPAIVLPFVTEIPHLPALTHCSLFFASTGVPTSVLAQVLAETPRLRLLLVLVESSIDVPVVYDLRFVIATYDSTYWDLWEAGAKGLPDYWSRGDEFVAKKRRGDIAESRYWLD
ncbi:hypothetical protein C8R46DRAFT_184935 [Mycena filopes]|nr:hypothetical protein C8R46DRAFT_184935 [Mycena filopes]